MLKIAMSAAASGLLRALIARADVPRDRILLTDLTSADWQSLTSSASAIASVSELQGRSRRPLRDGSPIAWKTPTSSFRGRSSRTWPWRASRSDAPTARRH